MQELLPEGLRGAVQGMLEKLTKGGHQSIFQVCREIMAKCIEVEGIYFEK